MAAQSKSSKGKSKDSSARRSGQSGALNADVFVQKLRAVANALAEDPKLSLKAAFATQDISLPIVLLSTQHLRVKRLVQWLRENLLPGNSTFASYFGGELSSAQNAEHIISDLVSLSLFAKSQLLVIYEADKAKAPAQKALAEALNRATDSSLLVLGAESVSQKAAMLQAAAEKGTCVELTELSGQALERWVEKEVQRAGISAGIEREAKALLIQCYGGDISRLAPEISKLALLVVPGEPLTRNLVEAISLKSPDVTSFELVKHLAAKNVGVAVSLVYDLIEQGLHPLQISAFLSRAIRILVAQKERDPSSPLPSDLNNPWFMRQLGNAVNAFSLTELKRAVKTLTDLDFRLKDSRFPPPLSMALAVQKIGLRVE
ncbi:MAG: DNA polymerase III subunit delta [Bdellovibrionota bacterium]